MAEFKEVINQWMRKCEECDKNEEMKCNINGYVCDEFYKMRKHINPKFIEQDVMSWAAEHPEPVYPMWQEWLNSMGLTKHDKGQFCTYTPNQYSYVVKEVDILNEAAYKPIPADIAQKLEIEPKEVER